MPLLVRDALVVWREVHARCASEWMRRHVSDPHVRASIKDMFRSRAAYKLIDINARFRIIKPGMTVIDLGSAPGSWTQVAVQAALAREAEVRSEPATLQVASAIHALPGPAKAAEGEARKISVLGVASMEVRSRTFGKISDAEPGSESTTSSSLEAADTRPRLEAGSSTSGRVIAVDLAPMTHVPGSTFVQGDFRSQTTRRIIHETLHGASAVDVVLSDMAHSFTGSGTTDHTLQMQLAWMALVFATQNLRLGGNVAVKTRYGDEYRLFCLAVKSCFNKVSKRHYPVSNVECF